MAKGIVKVPLFYVSFNPTVSFLIKGMDVKRRLIWQIKNSSKNESCPLGRMLKFITFLKHFIIVTQIILNSLIKGVPI